MTVYPHPGSADSPVSVKSRYEPLHRRRVGRPDQGRVLREHLAGQRQAVHRDRPRHRRGHRGRPRRRARRRRRVGPYVGHRARQHPATRSPTGSRRTSRHLAVAETWDNGKPVRETLAADLPLAVDHFRYFAGALRAQEGTIGEIDENTVAYHFHEPLGVVGADHPVELPDPDGRLEARAGAGRRQLRRPQARRADPVVDPQGASSSSATCCPPACSTSSTASASRPASRWRPRSRVAKVAFTGETTTGRLIMQYASQNLIPVTLELGGKSPNIFFDDVAEQRDAFYDKALEGFAMFALNQGEVCTCPSRALVQRVDLRRLRPRRDRPGRGDQAGQPARHRPR